MFQQIINRIKDSFDLKRDKEFFHRILESIETGVQFRGVNLYILIFAILICSLGLDVNSTAVIIGAMLISPLMGPIIGLGFSLGTTNWELLQKAGRNYLIATGIALLSSTLYFLVSPLNLEQSEMLMRTQPTIYDVLIAFFGGFAGIMATASKQKGNVIPGAAIATALMPPLCTAGYGLSEMNTTYLFGAFYLYIINTVFIAMATFLACRLLKLPSRQTEPDNIKKAHRVGLALALITFVPASYLGYNLYKETRFNNNAKNYISNVCYLEDNYLFSSKTNFDTKEIELVYGGSEISDSIKNVLISKRVEYDLEKANINIVESFSKPISEMKDNFSEVNKMMDEKDIKIHQLARQLDSFQHQYLVTETERSLKEEFQFIENVKITESKNEKISLNLRLKSKKPRRRSGSRTFYNISSEDSTNIIKSAQSHLGVKKLSIVIDTPNK